MKNFNIVIVTISALFLSLIFSCKKFIAVETPENSLTPASVFANDKLAISALVGIYQQMATMQFASGDQNSIAVLGGLSADELIGYDANLGALYNHEISSGNSQTNANWETMYSRINNINAILEGLEASIQLTSVVKSQLKGEALFVRAFCYFYLVNMYGRIPLNLSSDYKSNSTSNQSSVNQVYDQIVTDLKTSESLLGYEYITSGRVRPNKATVQALLARVYLYKEDWISAELYSQKVIERNDDYKLETLDQIFLINSKEAIWQLMPTVSATTSNTPAGYLFILNTTPNLVSLSTNFSNKSFEIGDERKMKFIDSLTDNSNTKYYFPTKYKIKSSATVSEYYMVFRLAEQYLIRAEARTHLENINGAIDDVDMLRKRAGLKLLKNTNPGISNTNLLLAIAQERKVELFTEWGDRWFDLKRTGALTQVLSFLKPNFKAFHELFPIPKNEVERNKNIKQNFGY